MTLSQIKNRYSGNFFKFREDITVHRIYKIGDDEYHLVFSTERDNRYYRVARFLDFVPKIQIMGYGTVASKFHKDEGIPKPNEIEKSLENKRSNDHYGWLNGEKIYG